MEEVNKFYKFGSFNYYLFIFSLIFFISSSISVLFKFNFIGIFVVFISLVYFVYQLRLYFKNKPLLITNSQGIYLPEIKKDIKWKDIQNIKLIRKLIKVSGPKSQITREVFLWLVINYNNKFLKLSLGEINAYNDRNKKKIEKLKKIFLNKKIKTEDFDVSSESLNKLKLNLFSSPKEFYKFLEENGK